MTDEDCTRIYNEANGISPGKRPPITTERIFKAMRASQQTMPEVTERAVFAYLTANKQYWQETDAMECPPARWRTGNPLDATRVSLVAALQALYTA